MNCLQQRLTRGLPLVETDHASLAAALKTASTYHRQICTALKAGDNDRAQSSMLKHIQSNRQSLSQLARQTAAV